jgi:UDP-N-acetylmuramoyl-tripeptide--D-alanyl-D-alanine ligase
LNASFLLMDHRRAARSLGAVLLPAGAEGGFKSVAVDSRKVQPGALFVALRGLASDGHRFLDQAFKAGAAAALVTRAGMEKAGFDGEAAVSGGAVLIEVDDTLKGLQNLAAAYLEQFPRLLRIGITGSSGKTTTKEIAAKMIGGEKKVIMNEGNLNSETGLPIAAFGVRGCHEVGIFEAGMNRRGEIGELAAVLKPHIALITNIGSAHIGLLGSLENIAAEKKEIFSRFTGKETALIPEDDPFRDYLARDVRGRIVFYGKKSLEASGVTLRDRGLAGTEFNWEGVPAAFGLPGKHNAENAAAAAVLAKSAGIGADAIRAGLAAATSLFGRGEILGGKTTVIRDCYNANPDSMERALAFCDGLEWKGRRVYILGQMLELGEYSRAAHERVGELLAASRADSVLLYGEEMEAAARVLAEKGAACFYTGEMAELKKEAARTVQAGDLVLLKGSRGCALEELTATVLLEEGV